MTVSVGLPWEDYPLSRSADRGLEVFDLPRSQLLICGEAGHSPNLRRHVEKNLFTPRVGWAIAPPSPSSSASGYSRNPQNDTSGRKQMPPFNAYPATIILTKTAPNKYSAVGNLAQGFPVVPIFD